MACLAKMIKHTDVIISFLIYYYTKFIIIYDFLNLICKNETPSSHKVLYEKYKRDILRKYCNILRVKDQFHNLFLLNNFINPLQNFRNSGKCGIRSLTILFPCIWCIASNSNYGEYSRLRILNH